MPDSGGPVQFSLDLGIPGRETEEAPAAASAERPEEIFSRVFRVLRPRTPLAGVRIEWRRYANVNSSIRWERGALSVKISDVLQSSPPAVMEALAHILLGKMFRKPVAKAHAHRYNLYLNRRDIRRDMHLLRQIRGRKFLTGAKGQFYDLAEIFAGLNARYFEGLLPTPALSWSRTRSKRLLGHFDPSHNAIVISRIFDQPNVRKQALEFVVYHEMLHVRYPTEYRGARRCIHTPEFKLAEKKFEGWKEASELLKRL